MTEMLKIPDTAAAPAAEGPEKGEDGYYSLQVRLPINNGETSGHLTTLVKLNALPEGIDLNDARSINLTLNGVRDDHIGFPARGFVSILKVIGVDTNADTMIFNLAVDDVDEMRMWHLDHVSFAQLTMPRDGQLFMANRPGAQFYLTVDFGHNVEADAEDEGAAVDNEGQPDANIPTPPLAPEGDNVTVESDVVVTPESLDQAAAEVPADAPVAAATEVPPEEPAVAD